jgi:hypothetical protein
MNVLFVGDVFEYLANEAKKYDHTAKLVTKYTQIKSTGTYYTSVGDSNPKEFYKILEKSDEIYYCKPLQWSDYQVNNEENMQDITEKYLNIISVCSDKVIHGYQASTKKIPYKRNNFLQLNDNRKTSNPQIWVSGCSISHGDGVSKKQRYGYVLSHLLKKEVSWLTQTGSSIMWARDQILRSDIRKDDLIFWGLTSPHRFPYYYNKKIKHITVNTFSKQDSVVQQTFSIDKLDDQDQIYQCITAIHQVNSFCNAIGAKLYLLDLFPDMENSMRYYCSNLKNFDVAVHEHDFFVDLGTDSIHPGPIQHLVYANKFLKLMEK